MVVLPPAAVDELPLPRGLGISLVLDQQVAECSEGPRAPRARRNDAVPFHRGKELQLPIVMAGV